MKKARYVGLGAIASFLQFGCHTESGPVLETHDGGTGGSISQSDSGESDSESESTIPNDNGNPGVVDTTGKVWGRGAPKRATSTPHKLDLLFVVDNSISMADKQDVLRLAVPDLVHELTTASDFERLDDIHIGVISSSLGGFGSDSCTYGPEQNDRAHLLGTTDRAIDLGLTNGFLRWTPESDSSVIANGLAQLITRTGELGCGFESTLEAWYRFLVDPEPYAEVAPVPCPNNPNSRCAELRGVDADLLEQREAFLRPDSYLAVVVVSDEDDCSVRPNGQYYYVARDDLRLPKSTPECEDDPNDPCCRSCSSSLAQGCAEHYDYCAGANLPVEDDNLNLRCFEQKRRFGIDFLYPVQRYAAALRNREILTEDGDYIDNPLFSGQFGSGRDPSMVVFATLVGVPWQDIRAVTDADGNDVPENSLRFKSAREMGDTWPLIVGNPGLSIPPSDPLMVQSLEPREGMSPLVGPMAPPTAAPGSNAANGHEWTVPERNDLQFACIFPLTEPKDCSDLSDIESGCDCKEERRPVDEARNPVCQSPATGEYTTVQYFGKAYPGTRHLLTAKGAGDNGVVASICPRNMSDDSRPDYGYRPALRSLLERFARQFE